jgi:hypothetical protein
VRHSLLGCLPFVALLGLAPLLGYLLALLLLHLFGGSGRSRVGIRLIRDLLLLLLLLDIG